VGQYEGLLNRLAQPGLLVHGQSDLAWLVRHPELIYGELGELYEKRGQSSAALEAYTLAQKSDEHNVDLSIRIVRLSLSAGQLADAKTRAQQLVGENHASTETLALLKEVYRRLGDPSGPAKALGKLHADHPNDRLLFYALLDELKQIGRSDEAERQLIEATRSSNADPDFTRRLFALYQSRDDVDSSMRLLVESLAARPDSLREIGPLWTELLKPARRSRLRLATLQKMQVPAAQEAARLFWVSRLAELWNRDALARSTLLQAAALKPAFAPVYRWLINDYWSRPDWDEQQKAEACEQLCAACEAQGNAALANELRGRCRMLQNDPAGAAKAFALAEGLGNHAPDLQLMHAKAIEREGNSERAEQLLWKLVSDWPQYEDAYADLFNLYLQRKSIDQAVNVVRKWIEQVPASVDGRLLAATIYTERGMQEEAQTVYEALFAEQPANPDVLRAMEEFYRRGGKMEAFSSKLEAERLRDPDNRQAVEELVSLYAGQHKPGDALRVLDAARTAGANDPDLLYYVAHLYERVEQKQTTETLLQEVVHLDPRHAGANNDLGYTWADEGRNLDRAEAMVRVAVEEEPDNQSYLDSMAWVEYKRGKFAEARTFLDRAIGPANRPDPVVLDHLGDVLYRLHQPADAAAQWKRSLHRIDESESARDDLKLLKGQLQQKLKQQEHGGPVDVAPVVENVVEVKEHAKN
jgi:predicted Zn-dependent protease